MMRNYIQSPEAPYLDALLVLGRGIKLDGELSTTGFERAEIAAELANIVFENGGIVEFSGGRSWRQALGGVEPPREGGAMLRHAISYSGPPRAGIIYDAEEDSESTIANMVNSQPRLKLPKGAKLGILSDELHFSYGRVQNAADLVFPDVDTYAIRIPRAQNPHDDREEKVAAAVTKAIMTGARPGNLQSITWRQNKLEQANSVARRMVRTIKPSKDKIANPVEHDTSYKAVPGYEDMSPAVLAKVLVGRL